MLRVTILALAATLAVAGNACYPSRCPTSCLCNRRACPKARDLTSEEHEYRASCQGLIKSLHKAPPEYLDWAANNKRYPGLTMQGPDALYGLAKLLEELLDDGVEGDLYETGTWRAGTAIFMSKVALMYTALRRHRPLQVRQHWYFDSFTGFKRVPGGERLNSSYYAAPLRRVRSSFARFGVPNATLHLVKGIFEETVPPHAARMAASGAPRPIALLRLDGDLYNSTRLVLDQLYEYVSPGGWVVIDDYDVHYGRGVGGKGCRDAVNEFREAQSPPITSVVVRKYGKPAWQKPWRKPRR
tara:strand:- start:560 stop:1456 length:897 start_codon:yes stop_codon:yes gene_type:complete